MGDQRARGRPGRPRRARSPGAGRSRPSAGRAGASAPCAAPRPRRERCPVAVRDADEDDPTAGPDRRDRVGERVVVAGHLERDVDRRVAAPRRRPAADAGRRPGTRDVAPSARAAATRWASRSVATTTRRAGEPQELDQQQAERAAAVDAARPPTATGPGRGRGARPRAARAGRPRRRRSRPAAGGAGAPATACTERSAPSVVPKPGEPGRDAHVRAAVAARSHPAARVGRIGDDPLPGPRTVDDDAAELVAEHERPAQARVADARPRDTSGRSEPHRPTAVTRTRTSPAARRRPARARPGSSPAPWSRATSAKSAADGHHRPLPVVGARRRACAR